MRTRRLRFGEVSIDDSLLMKEHSAEYLFGKKLEHLEPVRYQLKLRGNFHQKMKRDSRCNVFFDAD